MAQESSNAAANTITVQYRDEKQAIQTEEYALRDVLFEECVTERGTGPASASDAAEELSEPTRSLAASGTRCASAVSRGNRLQK